MYILKSVKHDIQPKMLASGDAPYFVRRQCTARLHSTINGQVEVVGRNDAMQSNGGLSSDSYGALHDFFSRYGSRLGEEHFNERFDAVTD